MKVRLTIDLELPETYRSFTDPELRMTLYEEFMRTVHQAHLESALEIEMDSGNHEAGSVFSMLQEARKYHLEWAKITDVPDWNVERL